MEQEILKRMDAGSGEVSRPGIGVTRSGTGTEAAIPDYLRRYYGWAYLWPLSVWFFDHQPIINAILFGHYGRIMAHTVELMTTPAAGRSLQIAAVYGKLTPTLAKRIDDLHVIDVAPVQLAVLRRKLRATGTAAHLARMDAETLHYEDDSFDTALMYLLLHELPESARRNSLREAIRVLRPDGKFVIAEYGELGDRHLLHRFAPFRRILARAEPFLDGFWRRSLTAELAHQAARVGKRIELDRQVDVFGGFYRVARYIVR